MYVPHRSVGRPRRVYAAVNWHPVHDGGQLLMLVGSLSLLRRTTRRPAPTRRSPPLYDTPLSAAGGLLALRRVRACLATRCRCPVPHMAPGRTRRGAHGGERDPGGRAPQDGVYGFPRSHASLSGRGAADTPGSWGRAVGIVYGALVDHGSARRDRKLVAYSVSTLGFESGSSSGTRRALRGNLQSVNHGLSTGAPSSCGGILLRAPPHAGYPTSAGSRRSCVVRGALMIACLSSIGLPAERLHREIPDPPGGVSLIAPRGLALRRAGRRQRDRGARSDPRGAVYLLWMYQRVMFGPSTKEKNRALPDIFEARVLGRWRGDFLIIWIGVYPNTFLRKLDVRSRSFWRAPRRGRSRCGRPPRRRPQRPRRCERAVRLRCHPRRLTAQPATEEGAGEPAGPRPTRRSGDRAAPHRWAWASRVLDRVMSPAPDQEAHAAHDEERCDHSRSARRT